MYLPIIVFKTDKFTVCAKPLSNRYIGKTEIIGFKFRIACGIAAYLHRIALIILFLLTVCNYTIFSTVFQGRKA